MPSFEAVATAKPRFGTVPETEASFDLAAGTGDDVFVPVFIQFNGFADHVPTVTIGGTSGVSLGTPISTGSGVGDPHLYGFGLHVGNNPGAQAIVVSHDGGDGSTGRSSVVIALAYNDVDSVTPFDGYNTAEPGSGTEGDITITSESGDLIVACAGQNDDVATWTTDDAGATERADLNDNFNGPACACSSDRAGAASVTCEHTSDTTDPIVVMGINLNAAGGSSGGVMRRRRELAAILALAAPTVGLFGQIFARSNSGLMVPQRMAA